MKVLERAQGRVEIWGTPNKSCSCGLYLEEQDYSTTECGAERLETGSADIIACAERSTASPNTVYLVPTSTSFCFALLLFSDFLFWRI